MSEIQEIEIEPTSSIEIDLLGFDISQVHFDYLIRKYMKQLNLKILSFEQSISKQIALKYELLSPLYDDPLHFTVCYNIVESFIPQIQCFDFDVVVRKGIVRMTPFVFDMYSGRIGRTNMLAVLAALSGSLKYTLERMNVECKLDFPDIVEAIQKGAIRDIINIEETPEYIVKSLKRLKQCLTIIPDNEWATWLATVGMTGRKVLTGLDYIIRSTALWSIDIHQPKRGDTLFDDVLCVWEYALTIESTPLWQKRLRFIEHLIYSVRERLVDLILKGTKATVNLTESWYRSGLFVYNTASNPLGIAALKTRTTLKGIGGFKELPMDLRLIDDSLTALNLCPIDTGDRENAGAVHFYTDTKLEEYLFEDRNRFISVFRDQLKKPTNLKGLIPGTYYTLLSRLMGEKGEEYTA